MAPWARRLGVFGVLCANKKKEQVKRDFGDLRIRRSEGRVVNTPLVFKRVLFQETGEDPERKKEEVTRKERSRKRARKRRGAGRLRKRRAESQSFDPCCCPRVKNADEKQRLADGTKTSCGESDPKTG
ncbi:hypothetical protein TNCV_3250501 [Trichonephila clavipes]|nr:hypothetical protein TNCV_3250501 [Trichonephila clavipes]